MTTKEENSVKCVAVGDAAVGKTCLLITYTTDKFPAEYVPTVFDNYETKLQVNDEWFTFQLWDTAGSEHYDVLRPLSYSDTDVFLVVYSVIDRQSFDNVEAKWVADIKEKGDKGVPFIVVGNKVDLRDNGAAKETGANKPVSFQEGDKLKNKLGAANFFEVSAYTQEGLKECFNGCIKIAFSSLKKKRAERGGEGDDDEKVNTNLCKCVIV